MDLKENVSINIGYCMCVSINIGHYAYINEYWTQYAC